MHQLRRLESLPAGRTARSRVKLVVVTAAVALLVDVVTKAIAVGVLEHGQRVPVQDCLRSQSTPE